MKLHVAVLSVLAVTLAGAPLIASAADTDASTPAASTAKHHAKAHHHAATKHAKHAKHSKSESESTASPPK